MHQNGCFAAGVQSVLLQQIPCTLRAKPSCNHQGLQPSAAWCTHSFFPLIFVAVHVLQTPAANTRRNLLLLESRRPTTAHIFVAARFLQTFLQPTRAAALSCSTRAAPAR
jgi:hypothetical protein